MFIFVVGSRGVCLGASFLHGEGGGVGGGVCVFVKVSGVRFCAHGLLATGSCVVRKHTPCRGEGLLAWRGLVASGYRFLAPPSSLLRLNPSVLYTERRRPPSVPFSGHLSMRSNHAALVDDCDEEECNRVGSVFAKFLCVSRRDVVSVAEECPLFQHDVVVLFLH